MCVFQQPAVNEAEPIVFSSTSAITTGCVQSGCNRPRKYTLGLGEAPKRECRILIEEHIDDRGRQGAGPIHSAMLIASRGR